MCTQDKHELLLNCLLKIINTYGIESQLGTLFYNQTLEILKDNGLEDKIIKGDKDSRFFEELIFDALESITLSEEHCRGNKELHDKITKIQNDINDLYYNNIDKQ